MEQETKSVFGSVIEGHAVNPWVYSSLVFIICFVILLAVRGLIWPRLRAWAKRSSSSWGNELLKQISLPVNCLLFVFSFGIAGQSAPLIVRTHPLMIHGVHVSMIVIAMWMIERAITVIFRSKAVPDSLNGSTRTLFLTISRTVLFALGFLIILDTIGISITPILASLGVGSVAVALALQDTLSNFFGGLYLLIDKPIRVDDYISVGDVEGRVARIGWRSTWIITPSDNVVVVPNNKTATSQVKNYDLPDPTCSVSLSCRVAMAADLEKIEQIALTAAKEVLKTAPGVDQSSGPSVYYSSFTDTGIELNIGFRVQHFTDAGGIKHLLIKALQAGFLRGGVDLPASPKMIFWGHPDIEKM